jgi:hypothetical protein
MAIFNTPTIASITAGFAKQVQQLEDLATQEQSKAITYTSQAVDLTSKAWGSKDTAKRATTLADRLKAFTDV